MPFPSHKDLAQPAFERSIGNTTLFSVPAGFLSTDHLAAFIREEPSPLLWLRAAPEDRDPAGLLISLVSGLAGLFPEVSARAFERMRAQPGPLYGWGPLFGGLARDLGDALPSAPTQPRALAASSGATVRPAAPAASTERSSAGATGWPAAPAAMQRSPFTLIIEHIDLFNDAPQTLELLWEHFLPLLPMGTTRILTRHTEPSRSRIPGYVRQVTARELQFDERACLALAHDSCIRLPARSLRRMATISEGREVVIRGLFSACQALGSETVNRCIDEAIHLRNLLSRLARAYLDESPPGTADLLSLALNLEYLNPPLIQAALGQPPEPPHLFLQPLSESWARLRCVWQNTLRAAIHPGETQGRDMLDRAARFLVRQGDFEQAIPLLFELGEPHEAARVIVQVVEQLMDLGQWETLSGWLKRLPEAVRREWPWLIYTEGELAAARGQDRASRRIFATATRLFQEHQDIKGACQSLLTESCLSAWQNELPQAQEYARQARVLAEKQELSWYKGWANWQLGRLSASTGNMDEALAFFNGAGQSAEHSSDIQMATFINQARLLVQVQVDQQQKKAQHVQAYYEADRAEHEAAARLRYLLENPASQADDLRGVYGWSRTPMFLKLAPPANANEAFPRTVRLFGLLRSILRAPALADAATHMPNLPPAVPGTASAAAAASEALALRDATGTASRAMTPLDATNAANAFIIPGGAGLLEEQNHATGNPSLPVTGNELPLSPAAGMPAQSTDRPNLDISYDSITQVNDQNEEDRSAPLAAPLAPAAFSDSTARPAVPAASSDATARLAVPAAFSDATARPAVPAASRGAIAGTAGIKVPSPQRAESGPAHQINAYLLGNLRVIIDENIVETLLSGRGRAVFAYLLCHSAHPIPREVIMEAFWPEASPEAARNSLNVAIYSLRQSLKAILESPVILFQDNAYLLNPDLGRWLDTEDFEGCVQEGRRYEAAGQLSAGARSYEKAISLYQGDLLADFPYEEWVVLERERLRVLYLETLDRLSLIYFSQNQYTSCVNLCNRMLTYDSCREDAHCRLMRCYARQGQGHLALRQYQACVEALRSELDVAPSSPTIQLYEQIRRRENV